AVLRWSSSPEIPHGSLAFDLLCVHGSSDLLLDLHRESRTDRRDARELVRIRLLEVLQRFEAPLEQRPPSDPADTPQGDQLEELLLHAVLDLNRQARQCTDFLLVEDPAELAQRVQQPFRLVSHTPDVPGPDPELLRDFLPRAFGDPVVEEGRRLYLREEEVVVLDRERQVRL